MNTMKKTWSWIDSHRSFSVAMAIAMLSTWVFSRVAMIKPAILQDEWIYSMSARKFSPWDQAPAYDFGNYLFNFVYQSTNICGDAFYTCGKFLNLLFFAGFILVLFAVALRFLTFWGAFAFMIAAFLSPLSVYVSMFLPESIYFFFLGLSLWFILKAAENPSWKSWAVAGSMLGLAGLAKPHALIAMIAIGIYVLVTSIPQRPFIKRFGLNAAGALGGFLVVRVLVGFIIAGPKSLNVFGAYGASSAVGDFVGTVATGGAGVEGSLVGAGAVAGAVGLFPTQITTHLMVISALLGMSVIAMIIAVLDIFKKKQATPVHNFALLTFIWLTVMTIAIVLFTGWVTGGGDDHTTRVLLRYYDYLFPIVSLAGLAVAANSDILRETKSWIRWIVIAPFLGLISTAFAGYFGTLTIQIADAPNLAGLVVDQFTLNGTGVMMFIAFLVIAFFPRFTVWAIAAVLPFSMISTGWQIQDQYQGFRAEAQAADNAGQFAKSFLEQSGLDKMIIVSESRFDGRVASFWADGDFPLEIIESGAFYDSSLAPEGTEWILTTGELAVSGARQFTINGLGYSLTSIAKRNEHFFSREMVDTPVESIQGFTPEMSWGVWTLGNQATITFKEDLPANAHLVLDLKAAYGISGQQVSFTLGDATTTVDIQAEQQFATLDLVLTNSAPSRVLTISIPDPKSNADLGIGGSQEKKGLGLTRLEVVG